MFTKLACGAIITGFFGLPYLYSDIRIYSSHNSEALKYVTPIKELFQGFYSTPWLNSGLLQSFFGSTSAHLKSDVEAAKSISYNRESYQFRDGGTYSLDIFGPDSKKILFIVPGLSGGSDSLYIKHIVLEAHKRNYRVIVMNGRGINGTPLTTQRTNQLGCSKDLKEILENIKAKHPESKIAGVGASMGGNQLLKYAGENGEKSVIDAFVALCAPFDIVICSRYLRKRSPISYLPDKFLVQNMLKVIKSNEDKLLNNYEEIGIDIEEVYRSERSFEFDSLFTCKLLGYKNPEHYYRKSSCVKYLHKIKKPALAISALDDPVVTSDCIPYEDFKSNPYLVLAETMRGGHIGWFTGMYPNRWYPKVTIEFLENVLNG